MKAIKHPDQFRCNCSYELQVDGGDTLLAVVATFLRMESAGRGQPLCAVFCNALGGLIRVPWKELRSVKEQRHA